MDKLYSLEEVERTIGCSWGAHAQALRQLTDTMRENERLREMLVKTMEKKIQIMDVILDSESDNSHDPHWLFRHLFKDGKPIAAKANDPCPQASPPTA